jgi:hypothetical protein
LPKDQLYCLQWLEQTFIENKMEPHTLLKKAFEKAKEKQEAKDAKKAAKKAAKEQPKI